MISQKQAKAIRRRIKQLGLDWRKVKSFYKSAKKQWKNNAEIGREITLE